MLPVLRYATPLVCKILGFAEHEPAPSSEAIRSSVRAASALLNQTSELLLNSQPFCWLARCHTGRQSCNQIHIHAALLGSQQMNSLDPRSLHPRACCCIILRGRHGERSQELGREREREREREDAASERLLSASLRVERPVTWRPLDAGVGRRAEFHGGIVFVRKATEAIHCLSVICLGNQGWGLICLVWFGWNYENVSWHAPPTLAGVCSSIPLALIEL